jgi:hypothetical protein
MKTLVLFLGTLLLSALSLAQVGYPATHSERYLLAQKENAGVGGADSTVQLLNRTYASGTTDTSEAIRCAPWNNTYVTLSSKDSISLHLKYQLSVDGQTWGVLTTLDSLSTGTGAGPAVKVVSLTSTILGAPYARFILAVTAFNRGTSTPTYSAYLVQKR